jgi:transposase
MNNSFAARYKLNSPCRSQTEFRVSCLDDLVPKEHKVRVIWDFVNEMDTSVCFEEIYSFDGAVGRSRTDPKILLTLWIYTILDGNCSARKLEELCGNHDVYKWICGGISVNRTSLAEFRSQNPRKFDELLTSCLAVMVKFGLINDADFSQDGTKVKANAGYNSFHREDTLKKTEAKLMDYISQLKIERKTNPSIYEKRKMAEAVEKQNRLKAALQNLEETRCLRIKNGIKNSDKPTEKELQEIRASTTDSDVRKMKMGDGGFRLAYNVQFATGLDSRVIYGVHVVKALDPGTPPTVMAQVSERLKKINLSAIKNWIADCAYSAKIDIETAALLFPNCCYYAPPKLKTGLDPTKENKKDSEAVKKWRKMINSEKIKEIYKKRCSTAEFSNMHAKNQSLNEFSVRGLVKVKGMALLHAIAQNCSRFLDLLKNSLTT